MKNMSGFKQYLRENKNFEFSSAQLEVFEENIDNLLNDFDNWIENTVGNIDEEELEALGYKNETEYVEAAFEEFKSFINEKLYKSSMSRAMSRLK